ncbi:MAG: hypothetical protein AAF085_16945 [Planctomycetota bacterium]
MIRPLNLTVLLAAVMLLVMPARAEKTEAIPPQAVGNSTMLAAYVDVTQIDPDVIKQIDEVLNSIAANQAMQGQGLALPMGDTQEMVDALTLLRGSFLQAVGEALD